jgi:hypothetical protein
MVKVMTIKAYHIYPVQKRPEFDGQWDGPAWKNAGILEVAHFRPESSDHRPHTQAKLMYGWEGIYGIFRVKDKYVRSVYRRHLDPVYKDSCVEFFVHPRRDGGYFNFEFNCGGTLLASYVLDPTRKKSGFLDHTQFSKEDVRQVRIYHSQPKMVDPEIEAPLTWYLEFFIPYKLLEKYLGALKIRSGTIWRCNLCKCADETSHPHWAAWSPVDALNFHLPHCFGELIFMSESEDP